MWMSRVTPGMVFLVGFSHGVGLQLTKGMGKCVVQFYLLSENALVDLFDTGFGQIYFF